ncbi:integral membrane protein [Bisbaumannia pacifica]|uniref:Integral membrane protein n=1 Tax=Bisbaumannia pacifica TaxID=77098 RepID=A0A510X7J7_9GAMM|nr:metal-dependent hydrolase [Halomonas pacifica]GEK46717.1 integral membrane protein [Halomonas pacifica]
MDSLTQAALGAAVGGAVLGRRLGRKAVLIGALLGTLPDLDVVLDYGDAVANVTEHRGFSHSLFVLTGLASLLALLCRRLAPARDISVGRWWAFFLLCLLTHPLLDALTTYGTQLWWPLAVAPVAYPIVFIIDPLYSLALLGGLLAALAGARVHRACAWGLTLAGAYLLFAAGAKLAVEQRLAPVLADRGLESAPRLVQPTPFNTLLWRATLIDGDDHYEALVGLFDGAVEPTLERYRRGVEWLPLAQSHPRGQRLAWFAGPFLRYEVRDHRGQETLIATDLRLGFPGFHPFAFSLASRAGDAWQPLPVSEQLQGPYPADGDRRQALARLASRLLGPEPPLCTSRFVAAEWLVEAPSHC